MSDLHIVFGTGSLGLAVMRELRWRGQRVRMVNRSSRVKFAKDPQTEVGGANAADPAQAREACEGAAVVYHGVGLPYPHWPEFPAIAGGIVVGDAAEAKPWSRRGTQSGARQSLARAEPAGNDDPPVCRSGLSHAGRAVQNARP